MAYTLSRRDKATFDIMPALEMLEKFVEKKRKERELGVISDMISKEMGNINNEVDLFTKRKEVMTRLLTDNQLSADIRNYGLQLIDLYSGIKGEELKFNKQKSVENVIGDVLGNRLYSYPTETGIEVKSGKDIYNELKSKYSDVSDDVLWSTIEKGYSEVRKSLDVVPEKKGGKVTFKVVEKFLDKNNEVIKTQDTNMEAEVDINKPYDMKLYRIGEEGKREEIPMSALSSKEIKYIGDYASGVWQFEKSKALLNKQLSDTERPLKTLTAVVPKDNVYTKSGIQVGNKGEPINTFLVIDNTGVKFYTSVNGKFEELAVKDKDGNYRLLGLNDVISEGKSVDEKIAKENIYDKTNLKELRNFPTELKKVIENTKSNIMNIGSTKEEKEVVSKIPEQFLSIFVDTGDTEVHVRGIVDNLFKLEPSKANLILGKMRETISNSYFDDAKKNTLYGILDDINKRLRNKRMNKTEKQEEQTSKEINVDSKLFQ